MEVVRAKGLDIAYDRVGDGPPLVFAHGAAGDARLWSPQLAGLADHFTVVAWDEPGAGRSSDVPASFSLADYAECLAALIEDLDLGPAHVAGLSWGGTVVLELYRLRPDLVTTLILADTYAGWKGSLPAAEVRARVTGAREMLAAPADAFDPTLPGLFAGDPPVAYRRLLDEVSADVRPATLERELSLMAETDRREVLPRVAVPTLLIWGVLDARSPLRVARQFDAAIPDTRLVVIPECGHESNLERPDDFNAAVLAFCREHGQRPPGRDEHAPHNVMSDAGEVERFYDRSSDLMRELLDELARTPGRPRTFPEIEDAIGWPRRRIASVLGGVARRRHIEFDGRRPYRFLDERQSASGRWELWTDADQASAIRAARGS